MNISSIAAGSAAASASIRRYNGRQSLKEDLIEVGIKIALLFIILVIVIIVSGGW